MVGDTMSQRAREGFVIGPNGVEVPINTTYTKVMGAEMIGLWSRLHCIDTPQLLKPKIRDIEVEVVDSQPLQKKLPNSEE